MIVKDMRRVLRSPVHGASRALHIGWESTLSVAPSQSYAALGVSLVEYVQGLDTGPAAFEECFIARQQLETIVRSCGYDMSIHTFGGLSVLGFLEVGGDVDFVGVSEVEPSNEEAGAIVMRISREMRRLGLRASALPRARVPLSKVQRVSRDAPGTEVHALSSTGIFQLTRALPVEEEGQFAARLRTLGAQALEWNTQRHSVSATFPSPTKMLEALATVKKHGAVDIPLRLPVDPRHGPELYRYPFDLCLSSTGLRNSALLGEVLQRYKYARHLLLTSEKMQLDLSRI